MCNTYFFYLTPVVGLLIKFSFRDNNTIIFTNIHFYGHNFNEKLLLGFKTFN